MMKKTTLFSLLVPAALLVGCHERSAVNGLTVEMLDCPLGVAAEHPRLSWRIESALPATVQTGYRILVSTDPGDLETGENLIWDSGDVPSDRSVLVPYEGPELESRRDYYWKVRVATNHGDTLWSRAVPLVDGAARRLGLAGPVDRVRQLPEPDRHARRIFSPGRALSAQGVRCGARYRAGAALHQRARPLRMLSERLPRRRGRAGADGYRLYENRLLQCV